MYLRYTTEGHYCETCGKSIEGETVVGFFETARLLAYHPECHRKEVVKKIKAKNVQTNK